MDVDKSSFPLILRDFEESLEQCHFIAVDQEMTGVQFEDQPPSWSMRLENLFQDSRKVVENFIAFQFGIALFTLKKDGIYEVKPYNFYLQKRSGEYLVNVGALEFLTLHKMDFKKWLSSAMPYCNKDEEEKLRMMKPNKRYSDIEEKITKSLLKKIEDWYINLNNSNEKNLNISSIMNKNIEKLALLTLKEKGIFVSLEYKLDKDFLGPPIDIIVSRVEKDVFESFIKELKQDKIFDLNKELGFRQFWKSIIKCKKPLIGHNFWSDIMFMVNMHEGNIASSYEQYKKDIHTLFPTVYDTKTLSRAINSKDPFISFHLEKLYQYCLKMNENSDKPLIFESPPGYHSYDPRCIGSHGKAHEAGYDAYMTGIVFALIKDNYKSGEGFKINDWENIISVFGNHYYMNLNGKDFLQMKGTFLLNFEQDIDKRLLNSFLDIRKYDEEDKNDQDKIPSVFRITHDINKEIGNSFVVQFIDETINEDDIQKRIELSIKEMGEWISQTTGEKDFFFPTIKKISRFEN
ncbi:ribonuclease [Trypanosoma theileri]|uniref:Ribonuclease n=1 Tax=Trypanosoma theileri TaxID=67003 RepID=A0A1X0NLC6_9TRYP|nr:ribonuclease [Trypanosoma theileri]ORC85572.1 ribonuclease [Trypanosoma theileri]